MDTKRITSEEVTRVNKSCRLSAYTHTKFTRLFGKDHPEVLRLGKLAVEDRLVRDETRKAFKAQG